MTLDRQQAMIHVGERTRVAIEGDEFIQLETGVDVRITPYRLREGGVKLDMAVEITKLPDGMPDADVVAETTGVRTVQEIRLGKTIQIPITARAVRFRDITCR